MSVLRLLLRNPALAAGAEGPLKKLADASELRVFEPDQRLVHTGAPHGHVIMLADGVIELYRQNKEAGTQVLAGVLSAPALFGDAELYGKLGVWAVSVRARVHVEAVFIPTGAFERLVDSDGKVAAALYRDAACRLLLAVQIMQVLSLQKTPNQVLRLLWRLGKPSTPGGPRVAPLSQVDLARSLGLNPRTIARNLLELERDGLIRRAGETVELLVSSDALFSRDMKDVGIGASWSLDEGEAQ